MRIRNSEDLRAAYALLQAFHEIGAAGYPKMAELKRKIRSFHHRPHNSRIIKDYGIDGYVQLSLLPSCLDECDGQDAEKWFEEHCVLRAIPSAFDCTGQAFTNWFKVVQRRGHWFVYHSIGYDNTVYELIGLGYTEDEAQEEVYRIYQELYDDLDEIYHAPSEEELRALPFLIPCAA